MRKKWLFLLLTLCVCVTFLHVRPVFALPVVIKHFNSYSPNQAIPLKDKIVDTNNFGPDGIVKDVSFIFQDLFEISPTTLADADILLTGFSWAGQNIPSPTEAIAIKDYVDQGGSLIVLADGNEVPRNAANAISSLFNGAYFSGWNKQGSTDIINWSAAPEITEGPFGTIGNLTWGSNAATRIVDERNSTRLDSFGMLSVITPTPTSGSVVFVADSNLFYLNYHDRTGNWEALSLNILSYSAHSSRINNSNNPIPEPTTMALFGFGLLGLAGMGRRKTVNI